MMLKTERLTLRKHVAEDATILHEKLGKNPKIYQYSAWNPYETPEMSRNTVEGFIEDYSRRHFYAWAIEMNGELAGTIGAYDYKDKSIEVGFSVIEEYWGHGIATEALSCVLNYLILKKDIDTVRAWSACENTGSRKVLEKCGMQFAGIEKNAIEINGNQFDKIHYLFKIPQTEKL